MANNSTRIADVIVPEVFNPYVIRRSMELSALYQSGIIANTAEFDRLANSGGKIVQMPYWEDLTGDDEVLSDSRALSPDKIGSGLDQARRQARGRAWGVNDLAHLLAGDDPMQAIADLVAGYWARRFQALTLATLQGAFASASMASNIHDISAEAGDAAVISAKTTVDAAQKLGDAKSQLTAFAMHSATEAALAKQDLIEYVRPSEGSIEVPTYMGKRVIVDDGLPAADGVYTSYLFGPGALALGNGDGLGAVPLTETDRDSLAGEDYLINRRVFILHPRGVKWTEASITSGEQFPTNTDLANGANWERVYEPKAIRIVKFVHRLEPAAA